MLAHSISMSLANRHYQRATDWYNYYRTLSVQVVDMKKEKSADTARLFSVAPMMD